MRDLSMARGQREGVRLPVEANGFAPHSHHTGPEAHRVPEGTVLQTNIDILSGGSNWWSDF
jgi:hypothetical protein